ncbi:copper homeostasis protein CutC [Oceanihabitans sp. IOP_32]|uniref:copper homeostasis protein CutC n=1 Tax=Oceanihabitans sp. IOP_32 TaxID=2529032 RepID=UPI001292FD5A|nr:copper homeostasis protein CutC [Oceanihabitans sp. IOP_32]QFZ54254.1 copper homeostasis protein CutC [Oceanihabitans sp. IOP_32]
MKVEICANSYRSAINAEKSGAHRIELCAELAVGGITPSFGLIKKVITTLKIPVFVLIRPRSGNFTYSDDEFEIMKSDIAQCKALGCHGVVSGVLNKNNTIDVERTKVLVELAKPMAFTFHRAFDWVITPEDALEELASLGVNRVLTSGQETSALLGLDLLTQLNERAKNRIIILPGGGIHAENAKAFKTAGFNEIHCSATTIKPVIETPKVSMQSLAFFDETTEAFSDSEKISQILERLR